MSWVTDRIKAQDAARIGTWPTFAGHLCATHLNEWVEVNGEVGRLRDISHSDRFTTIRVILERPETHPLGRTTFGLILEPDDVLYKLVRSRRGLTG